MMHSVVCMYVYLSVFVYVCVCMCVAHTFIACSVDSKYVTSQRYSELL